jgi:outer membrane protein assembly factor BamB
VSNRAELVCADIEGFTDGENDGPFKDEKYKDPIDGDFIWVYDMMEELGVFPHNLATSSPLIVNDLIFIMTSNGVEKDHITIPAPRAPSFIAVRKDTGELVWESAAPGEKILHGQWSAPSYTTAGGRPQVIFSAGDGWVRSFEPATGKLFWQFDCNPKDAVYELGGKGTRNYIVATPVCAGDNVYIAVGQDPEHGVGIGHLYSIDATKNGDVTESGKVWHYGGKEFRRTLSTVAVKDGLVYAADLAGYLHCLDQKTGRPYWVHDMLAAVWGSPTWIDGKVYLGDEDGDVVVFQAGKELKILSEVNLDNAVYTTPVAANGILYINNRTHLYALAESK